MTHSEYCAFGNVAYFFNVNSVSAVASHWNYVKWMNRLGKTRSYLAFCVSLCWPNLYSNLRNCGHWLRTGVLSSLGTSDDRLLDQRFLVVIIFTSSWLIWHLGQWWGHAAGHIEHACGQKGYF